MKGPAKYLKIVFMCSSHGSMLLSVNFADILEIGIVALVRKILDSIVTCLMEGSPGVFLLFLFLAVVFFWRKKGTLSSASL